MSPAATSACVPWGLVLRSTATVTGGPETYKSVTGICTAALELQYLAEFSKNS